MSEWHRIRKRGKRRGETAKEFAAFQKYLMLGPYRSIRKALEVDSVISGRSIGTIRYWEKLSSRWKWVARSSAYDESCAADERREHEKRSRDHVRKIIDFKFRSADTFIAEVESLQEQFKALLKLPRTDVEIVDRAGNVNRIKGVRAEDICAVSRAMVETAMFVIELIPPADTLQDAPNTGRTAFRFIKSRARSKKGSAD